MKSKKIKPYKIYLLIGLILIMQSPLFFLNIILHEQSHKWDYRNIPKTNEDICYFNCKTEGAVGYHSFQSEPKYKPELERIDKFTEKKAYLIGAMPVLAYCLGVMIVLRGVHNIIKREVVGK